MTDSSSFSEKMNNQTVQKIKKLTNFVGGDFVVTPNVTKLTSAFDSSLQYEVSDSDLLIAIQAIQVAQKSFYSVAVAVTDIQKNIKVCTQFFDFLQLHKAEITRELAQFQGVSLQEVLGCDVELGLAAFHRVLKEAEQFDLERYRLQANGLVIIFGPAILSFKTLCERLAPALMAGNAILLKPSSKNPLAGQWLAKAAQESEAAAGFLNVVYGRGEVIGSILSSHPSVRAVSFAGSLRNAESVIKTASAQFKKLQVSTTAKNIAAVLADADLDLAVREILKGTLFLSGQSPFSIHRIFVVDAIASQFIERLRLQVEKVKPIGTIEQADPLEICYNMLSKTSTFDAILSTAKEAHAKVMSIDAEFFGAALKPIFTLDMTNCSTLQQDDIQAPFVIVTSVKYQHEVQKFANVGYYGSTAFLFGSKEKCEKVMAQLQARDYFFNEWKLRRDPFVSSRQSFFGDSNFKAFGSFYSELKTVTHQAD